MNVNNLIDEFEYIQIIDENPFGIKMTYFDKDKHMSQIDAFNYVNKLKEKTKFDWRLPTTKELDWIISNIFEKYNIGTHKYYYLWSSEAESSAFGWVISSDNSYTTANKKLSKEHAIYISVEG